MDADLGNRPVVHRRQGEVLEQVVRGPNENDRVLEAQGRHVLEGRGPCRRRGIRRVDVLGQGEDRHEADVLSRADAVPRGEPVHLHQLSLGKRYPAGHRPVRAHERDVRVRDVDRVAVQPVVDPGQLQGYVIEGARARRGVERDPPRSRVHRVDQAHARGREGAALADVEQGDLRRGDFGNGRERAVDDRKVPPLQLVAVHRVAEVAAPEVGADDHGGRFPKKAAQGDVALDHLLVVDRLRHAYVGKDKVHADRLHLAVVGEDARHLGEVLAVPGKGTDVGERAGVDIDVDDVDRRRDRPPVPEPQVQQLALKKLQASPMTHQAPDQGNRQEEQPPESSE